MNIFGAIVVLSLYLIMSIIVALMVWNDVYDPYADPCPSFLMCLVFFPAILFILLWWLYKKLNKFINYFMRLNYQMHHAKKERIAQELKTKEQSA